MTGKIRVMSPEKEAELLRKRSGRRRFLPPHIIRKMNAYEKGSTKGHARCNWCKKSFIGNYCRPVRVGFLSEEMACRDCVKNHKLEVIP